jgi:hypothetical protein
MTVHVHYRVPVVVEVDVEREEVIAVHVIDEQIEGPVRVVEAIRGTEPEQETRSRALELAEESAWPGWRAGW